MILAIQAMQWFITLPIFSQSMYCLIDLVFDDGRKEMAWNIDSNHCILRNTTLFSAVVFKPIQGHAVLMNISTVLIMLHS